MMVREVMQAAGKEGGASPETLVAALPEGWAVEAVHPLRVPGLPAQRHLVVVRRV